MPTENPRATFVACLRSGFTPQLNEIEELRHAYGAMNDAMRNLMKVRECLRKEDFRMADHHLRAAESHTEQAKQKNAALGQVRAQQ